MKIIVILLILAGIAPALAENHVIGPFNVSFDGDLNLTEYPQTEQETLQGVPVICYALGNEKFQIFVSDFSSDLPPGEVDLEPFLANRRSIAEITETTRRIDGSLGKIAELYYPATNATTYIAMWWTEYNTLGFVTSRLPFNQTSRILKTIHIERIK